MLNKDKSRKCQHFIPQGYLRKFTIENEKSLIWEYDKENGLISERPVSVRKVCFRNYYYYQRNNKGEIDHVSLEDAFSKIENTGIQIIEKLKTENLPSRLIINEEEHGQLAFFIALVLTRNPGVRDGINQFHGSFAHQTLHGLYNSGSLPEPPTIIKDLLEQKGIDNVMKLTIFPEVSLGPMIEIARAIALEMLKKIWVFYIPADNKTFITSDNPVSFRMAEGYPNGPVGPSHPYAEITIPLRKDLALITTPSVGVSKDKAKELQYACFRADEQGTSAINKRTAASALQHVYSSQKSDELLDLVKSLRDTIQKLIMGNEKEKKFSIAENPYEKT